MDGRPWLCDGDKSPQSMQQTTLTYPQSGLQTENSRKMRFAQWEKACDHRAVKSISQIYVHVSLYGSDWTLGKLVNNRSWL